MGNSLFTPLVLYNQPMLLAKNRKVFYDSEIIEKYTAGIILEGYEVKAVREGRVNFDASYVQVIGNKVAVVNMYIGPYSKQSQKVSEKDCRKTRYLLLNKKEIEEITRSLSEKGRTALPLALILTHKMVKLEVGIAKGRKKAEKRLVEKERQMKRDLEVATKELTKL